MSHIKNLIKIPLTFILKIILYLEAIILAPFLLTRFNKIWKNKIIFPFYHHSFGHTIVGIDCIARLFFPERLTLIVIPHRNTNKYLIQCFNKSYDIFYINFLINFGKVVNSSEIRFKVIRFYVNIISFFKSGYLVINSFEKYYGILSSTLLPCEAGVESKDIKIPYINLSGYGRLLANNVGLRPILSDYEINFCKNVIQQEYPQFYDKPFITLLLRSKETASTDFSNSIRNTDQTQYIKAVEYATSIGFNVVPTGDTNASLFNNINGFFDFNKLGISPQLLNIYLITNCNYFVGQQSGPFTLANSCGINCLLIDSWPHRLGSYLPGDINLYKKIVGENNVEIKILDLFRYHQDLCLGYGYKRKNVKVIDNNEEEIYLSFVEFLNGKFSDDKKLQILKKSVPLNMPFKYLPSRPPVFILDQITE